MWKGNWGREFCGWWLFALENLKVVVKFAPGRRDKPWLDGYSHVIIVLLQPIKMISGTFIQEPAHIFSLFSFLLWYT